MTDEDFIEWVVDHKPDPWNTMANNVIMWNDQAALEELKRLFWKQFESVNQPKPVTITLRKANGQEIELVPLTNYNFNRLREMCCEALFKESVEAEELSNWLVENHYYAEHRN